MFLSKLITNHAIKYIILKYHNALIYSAKVYFILLVCLLSENKLYYLETTMGKRKYHIESQASFL